MKCEKRIHTPSPSEGSADQEKLPQNLPRLEKMENSEEGQERIATRVGKASTKNERINYIRMLRLKNRQVGKYIPHGLSRTIEYGVWSRMLSRCYSPSDKVFAAYGGRGIRVCDKWFKSFCEFFYDMGFKPSPRHSIDRINNDGNYEPSNCRWATSIQQCNNKSTNVFIEYKGRKQTATQWAREIGIGLRMVHWRIQHGWTVEDALETPSQKTQRKDFRDKKKASN